MSWLRIAAYYLSAIVLTVHLLGLREEAAQQRAPETPQQTAFLEAVPERIDHLRMEKDDLVVEFERREGRWIVTEPEGLSSPSDVVDAILESFTSLPPIEIVADGIEHEGQFGFVPPRARLRIEQQGTLVSTIVLGELSPTRTAVYAKRSGKEEVALIGLNSKYYIDLVFENVRRQRQSSGIPGAPVSSPPPAAPAAAPPAAPLAR